ncbi:MAG: molybdopterin molybdenumtransferase MoeA, partial [Firmicutes bacterium]|nr:molybdopterin molybdenumtransferase MoeA [Bacillota bacterium]
MLTVEEAREQMLAHVRRLEPEHVDIRAALGRVLAEPIVSRRVIPPWPNSSMDGYAVRAADTTPAPVVLTVTGRVARAVSGNTGLAAMT